MQIIIGLGSVIYGLIFGSFLNVLIYRLNEENVPRFWQGRSFCPRCKHLLSWQDNIPLISFLSLGGNCRYCHKSISWQYPVVEFVTAISTVFVVVNSNLSTVTGLLTLFSLLLVTYCLIVIFFSDLKYSLIPDEMVLSFTSACVFLFFIAPAAYPLFPNLLVGLLASLALLLIVLVTKGRGLGLGDVKFALPMGFFLGFPNTAVAFWVAFISGGIISVLLVVLKLKNMKQTIPLGPFLVLGVIVAFFGSRQLLALIGL